MTSPEEDIVAGLPVDQAPTADEGTAETELEVRATASARVVLLARVVGLVATFLGSVALARALGPDGRGAHGFFVAVTVILVAVAGLSLPVGDYILMTRMGAARRALAANGVWLAVAAATVSTLVVGAAEALLGFLPPELTAVPAWPAAIFLAIAGFAYNAHQLQLSLAGGRALLGAFLSFGTYAIAAVGYVFLLLLGGGLPAAIWMLVAAPYLAAAVASFARPPFSAVSLGSFDRPLARRTLHEGLRFYPGELAAMLHLRLDVILLGILTPASTVGMYVVAYQTAEPILVIASAAQATILAFGGSSDAADRSAAVARLIRETIVLAVGLCVVAVLLAPLILPAIYGQAFAASVQPFLLLLPAVLMLAIGRIAAAELTRRNRLEATVVVAVAAMLTNLCLNLILIPILGATGAAIASLVSYSAQAGLALAYLHRIAGMPWRAIVPGSRDVVAVVSGWNPKAFVGAVRRWRARTSGPSAGSGDAGTDR